MSQATAVSVKPTSYWVIEIGLGSFGQRKQSSRFLEGPHESPEAAREWGRANQRADWGTWDVAKLLYVHNYPA